MNKKKGNLFEQHVDKIIYAIVGILCLLLLWMFVLSSPYDVEIEPGRKASPGEIDAIVKREADRLNNKLEEDYVPKPYTKNRTEEFEQLLGCSIKDVPQVALLLPGFGEKPLTGDRKYYIPDIVDVKEVAVASIRSAAQIPEDEDEITPGNPYKSTRTVIGDIDLVSVEGKIDVKSLFANFDQNFAGRKVTKLEWRDENFAKPVFAGIELQRSRKLEDESWSEWETVPRTKIDPYKSLLTLPDKTEDLKYDINLIKAQFDMFDIMKNILQPEAYEFAYTNTKWMAPSIYTEYQEAVKQEQLKKKLEEKKNAEKTSTRGGTTRRTTDRTTNRRTTDSRSGRNQPGGRPDMMAMGMDRGGLDPRDPRLREMGLVGPGQGTKKPQDIAKKMKEIELDKRTPLNKLDTVTIWAHDDDIQQPGEYRYRMRVGVFNPIGGRDWFYPDQEQYKDQVILWSQYSPPTETVQIYPMIEFFPQFLVADSKDTVKIEVSKYYRGKWRTKEFDVRVGEPIGATVEEEPDITTGLDRTIMLGRDIEPEKIPYETGAVLVDVITTNRWLGRGSLQEQEYEEILYTKDGSEIEHLSVRERNWPDELKLVARAIKDAKTTEQQGESTFMEGQRPEMMGPEMMGMDPMMMQMMMMRGGAGGGGGR